jgi:hypothetical protein
MANTATDTHRPARSRVRVTDRAEMRHFLEGMYGARLRGPFENRMAEPHDFGMTHERTDVGPLAVDMVRIPGDFEASIDPMDRVVTIWATDGKVAGHCDGLRGEAAAGDVTLLSQPGRPHRARAEELTVTSVLMDPSLLAGVAAGVPPGHARVPIRFSSFRPVSPAAGRLWKDTVSYVKDSVLADDIAATPLVLGHVSRLLAAITLSTFPNSAAADPAASDRTDHRPVLLTSGWPTSPKPSTSPPARCSTCSAVTWTPHRCSICGEHASTTPTENWWPLTGHATPSRR